MPDFVPETRHLKSVRLSAVELSHGAPTIAWFWAQMESLGHVSSFIRYIIGLCNGARSKRFKHGRVLQQADPLSPLFVIAIDPLQKLFHLATQQGLLCPIHHISAKLRVSLYVDDDSNFHKSH